MRVTSMLLTAAVLAGAAPWAAHAQVLTVRDISLQLARTIADASIAACKTDGFDVSVAVVDRAGDLKLLLRADTSNPHNADLARRKAYTARTFGVTSTEFRNRTSGASELDGPALPRGSGPARRRTADRCRHGTHRRTRVERRARPGGR